MKGFFFFLQFANNKYVCIAKKLQFYLFYTTIFFSRSLRRMSPFNWNGLKVFLLRLCLLPAFYFLLWIFYYHGFDQGSDVSNNLKFPFFFLHFHPHAISRVFFLQFFFHDSKIINTKELLWRGMDWFSIAWPVPTSQE